jgi:hypothetical protein
MRRFRFLLVLAAISVASVGCGGGGDADGGAEGDVATTPGVEEGVAPEVDERSPVDEAPPAVEPGSDAGAVIDACVLVTQAEAADLLGEEVTSVAGEGTATCRYQTAGPNSVVIEVTSPGGARAFDGDRDLLGVDTEPDGDWDGAFTSGNVGAALVGDTMVSVTVAGALRVADELPAALADAVGRLPS